MEIKELLVPTDFSDNAERALSYALNLAKRCSAKIHVLHVPEIPMSSLLEAADAATPELTRRTLTEAQKAVDAVAARLREEAVECETALREGVVHKAIQQYALDHQISMVVMGAHGRTGISKRMYGSVTGRVLRTLPTPTIVVPPHGAQPPHAIVVAYDFSAPAKRAAEAARAIHGVFRGQLYLVHAYLDAGGQPSPVDAISRKAAKSRGEATKSRREALRLGLNKMLDAAASDLFSMDTQSVQTKLVTGDPVDALLVVAQEVGAHLICAGTTGKGGIETLLMGSVARRLVQESPVPVLLTHDEEQC